MIDERRLKQIKKGPARSGPVIYVMSRDQRADDNWAMLAAQEMAMTNSQPLVVIVAPVADCIRPTLRQVRFSLDGLKEIEKKLSARRIPLMVIAGPPEIELPGLINDMAASALFFDFSPLKRGRLWRQKLSEKVSVPVYEADAHNIVPCLQASNKMEYAAYTLRPKINRQLPEFLTDFPEVIKHPFPVSSNFPKNDWGQIESRLVSDPSIKPVETLKPGAKAAFAILDHFLTERLSHYAESRNDPNLKMQSDLSPYLHFGQISAQRVALLSQRFDTDMASQEAFLEELIIRRELSDNFCYYNPAYDSVDGFPEWGRKTLDEHRLDPRPYLYDLEQLETAATHDDFWNTAQMEMVITGKMHGYMRMYWAKKILEWSVAPEAALDAAIYLNDKYELDGNDPNGHAGIAWSIGGVHDRPWFERDIFGKIRYMSYTGCRRKFDIGQYIASVAQLRSGV